VATAFTTSGKIGHYYLAHLLPPQGSDSPLSGVEVGQSASESRSTFGAFLGTQTEKHPNRQSAIKRHWHDHSIEISIQLMRQAQETNQVDI